MVSHVAHAIKTLAAKFAFEGFLTRVYANMDIQVSSLCKLPPAAFDWTFEKLLPHLMPLLLLNGHGVPFPLPDKQRLRFDSGCLRHLRGWQKTLG